MDKYETQAEYNMAETCAASISLNDLQDLSDSKLSPQALSGRKLTYGSIRGSDALRTNLAKLYSARATTTFSSKNIMITPGAIAANFNVLYALIGKGDHVICHYPTYQQLYEVPASLGEYVLFLEITMIHGMSSRSSCQCLKHTTMHCFLFSPTANATHALKHPRCRSLALESRRERPVGASSRTAERLAATKHQADNHQVCALSTIIGCSANCCSNPNNPTGAIIPKHQLQGIIDIAQEQKLLVLSDEVYRPLFHSISPASEQFPPSLLQFPHDNVVVTGSMSKAYSLAGIRVGWIASRSSDILDACSQARDYTTISVSQVDDQIAAYALSQDCVHNLLGRNVKLASTNLGILDNFVERHSSVCSWVKPVAGTTAFVRFSISNVPVNDVALCEQLIKETGILVCPGSRCFGDGTDFKGYVRIGFVCVTAVLLQGLDKLAEFIGKRVFATCQ